MRSHAPDIDRDVVLRARSSGEVSLRLPMRYCTAWRSVLRVLDLAGDRFKIGPQGLSRRAEDGRRIPLSPRQCIRRTMSMLLRRSWRQVSISAQRSELDKPAIRYTVVDD
jgi:hypothetical protein